MPEIIKPYCPFGCRPATETRQSDFDDKGYCRHLAGFINLEPGQSPEGKLFEPLQAIEYQVRDEQGRPTGAHVHSGLMAVRGKQRQPILPGDVVVSPEELQAKQTTRDARGNIVYEPKLGLSCRVYRRDADTPIIADQDDERLAKARLEIEEMQAALDEKRRVAEQMDLNRKERERAALEANGPVANEADMERNAEAEKQEARTGRRRQAANT